MKKYEIEVDNGAYTLSYMAKNIAEAYSCICALPSLTPKLHVNAAEVMVALVAMHRGEETGYSETNWGVTVRETDA